MNTADTGVEAGPVSSKRDWLKWMGGAALAPVLAGYLFQAGMGLQVVAVVMACGSLLGALALWFLKEPPAD